MPKLHNASHIKQRTIILNVKFSPICAFLSSLTVFLAVFLLPKVDFANHLPDDPQMLSIALHCRPAHHLPQVHLLLLPPDDLPQSVAASQQVVGIVDQELDVLVRQSQDVSVVYLLDLPHKCRLAWSFHLNRIEDVEASLLPHQQVLEIAVDSLLLEVASQRNKVVLPVRSLLQHLNVLLHNPTAVIGHSEVESVLQYFLERHYEVLEDVVAFGLDGLRQRSSCCID
jgi:hypothetical protein